MYEHCGSNSPADNFVHVLLKFIQEVNLNFQMFMNNFSCLPIMHFTHESKHLFVWLILYKSHSTILSHVWTFSFLPGLNQLKQRIKCLAQGHNPVPPLSWTRDNLIPSLTLNHRALLLLIRQTLK